MSDRPSQEVPETFNNDHNKNKKSEDIVNTSNNDHNKNKKREDIVLFSIFNLLVT